MEKDKNKLKKDDELKTIKDTVGVIKNINGTISGVINTQKMTVDTMNGIFDIIKALERIVAVLFFLVSMLIWRVFLWDPFNKLLDVTFYRWGILPEEYKFLILSIIGSIPAMIIAHIVGSILLEKIKKCWM